MSVECGMSRNTVKHALAELEQAGSIRVVKRGTNQHELHGTIYEISAGSNFDPPKTDPPKTDPPKLIESKRVVKKSAGSKTDTPHGGMQKVAGSKTDPFINTMGLQREDEPLSVCNSNTGIGSNRSETGNSLSPTRSYSSQSETDACAAKTSTALVLEPAPVAVAPKRQRKAKPEAKSAPVWQAYCRGYERRYGELPIPNMRQYKSCCQIIDRIGVSRAAELAEWYPTSRNMFYAAAGHPLPLLVRDCEQLYTQLSTGRQITRSKASEDDRLAEQGSVWDELKKRVAIEKGKETDK
jgi:hypothetical protein